MFEKLETPDVLSVLFHPRRDDFGITRDGAHLVMLDIGEVTLGGRLFPAPIRTPNSEAPLILYYHGNGEIAADYDNLEYIYTQMGIALLVMDYRGYGTSGGTPTAASLVTDAHGVIDALDELLAAHSLKPSKIYVMGRSLGSVSAIETACYAGNRLAGLIVESGFSDTFGLLNRLGSRVTGDEETEGFANAHKMQQVTIPTLVLHGEQDILIPPSDGAALYSKSKAHDREFALIPGAGHNDIMITGMDQYFAAIREFVL